MTKPKSINPSTLAAVQPHWHADQAVAWYAESVNTHKRARARDIARRKFIEHMAAALESQSLNYLLTYLQSKAKQSYGVAETNEIRLGEALALAKAIAGAVETAPSDKPF